MNEDSISISNCELGEGVIRMTADVTIELRPQTKLVLRGVKLVRSPAGTLVLAWPRYLQGRVYRDFVSIEGPAAEAIGDAVLQKLKRHFRPLALERAAYTTGGRSNG